MDRQSDETLFPWIEQALQYGSAGEAFEQLVERFRRAKQYRLLFDARLMQTRLELGLPLVSTSRIGDVPKELQEPYQNGYVLAAREVGELLLADHDIPRAWPYFRAIGDTAAIVHALDTFDAPDPDTPGTWPNKPHVRRCNGGVMGAAACGRGVRFIRRKLCPCNELRLMSCALM